MTGHRHGRTRLLTTVTLALISFSFGVAGQGRPPTTTGAPAGQAEPPATGVILGRVIDGDSGRPVSGAMVILGGGPRPVAAAAATADLQLAQQQAAALAGGRRGAAGPPVAAMTNGDGRFMFRDLGRGTYNLSAQVPGYAPGAHGRRRPDGPPRGIDLAQDERLTDVVVRVWKFAVVSGTVIDETGEPVVAATVRPLRRVPVGGTGLRLQAGAPATTDDRGMFRLSALTPGDYLIAVPSTVTTLPLSVVEEYLPGVTTRDSETRIREQTESGAPFPSAGVVVGDFQVQSSGSMRWPSPDSRADGRVTIYPTTYFPAATSAAAATTVTLKSGEERGGVDLQIRLVPGVRVSGTAVGPDGPLKMIGVRLVPAGIDLTNTSGFETAETASDASGRFTLLGVPPGSYVVSMARVPRAEIGGRGAARGGGPPAGGVPPVAAGSWGEQPITVGAENVDGITITLRPGADVAGHIEFEGTAPRPPAQRLQATPVSLLPADGRVLTGTIALARADAEGRFRTSAYPPGRYWLNLPAPGPEWSLKSVMVNGVNAQAQAIELTTSPITGVVVTFTDRVTQLTGTVQGDPATIDGASVVVFPADVQAWIERGMSPRLQFSTTTSKTGAFQVRVPTAGEYLVAALSPETSIDNTATFFAALARVATRVTLNEGDVRTLSLSVSRPR